MSCVWWRHQMEAVSVWLALCVGNPLVTGGFPSQMASHTSFDIFFDVSLNQRLNKLSIRRWFETPGCSLWRHCKGLSKTKHYSAVIMGTSASQTTSLTIVYSTVYSGADQIKHQSSASVAFVHGIPRWPVNSPHKWSVTRKVLPFDDVIMPQRSTKREHDSRDIQWSG